MNLIPLKTSSNLDPISLKALTIESRPTPILTSSFDSSMNLTSDYAGFGSSTGLFYFIYSTLASMFSGI